MLRQPLRPGNVGQPLVEDGFQQRIAPGNGVADDEDVRIQGELVGGKAFDEIDPGVAQLVAHGRVDVGIAAGDAMPRRPGELGDATHEGAADAENMNVHVTKTR